MESDVLSFDDLLAESPAVPVPQVRRKQVPLEVVYHWTNWHCQCGSEFHSPTYGGRPMAKFEVVYGKKHIGYISQPLPTRDALRKVPRRLEIIKLPMNACPRCIMNLPENDLELPEPVFSQDIALFHDALEAMMVPQDIVQKAEAARETLFDDKETN